MAIFGKYSPQRSRRHYSQGSPVQEEGLAGLDRLDSGSAPGTVEWDIQGRRWTRPGVAAVSRQPRMPHNDGCLGPDQGNSAHYCIFFLYDLFPNL